MKNPRFIYVYLFVPSLLFCAFLGTSCHFFTASLAKNLQRDQTEVLNKASAAELIAFSRRPYASSVETMNAVMFLLSGKERAELAALALHEKEAVLKLAMDISFPINTLRMTALDALAALDGGLDNEETGRIIAKLIDNVNTFDTRAVSAFLTDTEVMRSADPSFLTDASIALLIQMTADVYDAVSKDIDFKNDDTEVIINKIFGGKAGFEEKKEALRASITAIKLLSGVPVESSGGISVRRYIDTSQTEFIGLIPLDRILAAFGK